MQNYKSYYPKLQIILHKTANCTAQKRNHTTQKRNHTTIYLHNKTLPFLHPTVRICSNNNTTDIKYVYCQVF